ncbi:MAG: glycosyltransferase [Planctomycetota bacterium]|nr:glycosyltransferase [Planctomycetota bacterium]
MKVAFFAKSHKRSNITTHIVRGLEALGHEVLWINRHKLKRFMGKSIARWWIRKRIESFSPALILIFTRDMELPMLRELSQKYKTAQFYDDCNVPLRDEVVEYGQAVGHFFITARGQVSSYEERGVKPISYVTGGCDSIDHHRVEPQEAFKSEVAFIGSPGPKGSKGQKDRVELMKRLAAEFDLKVYGRGWQEHGIEVARESVYPEQYRIICASSKVMIGLDSQDDVDLYFSNRTWITMGCGGLLATRYIPKLEEILEFGKQVYWWKDFDECLDVTRKAVNDAEKSKQMRDEAFAYAHKEYSYTRMVERMLAAIEEKGA